MRGIENLRDMLCEELDKIAMKGELTAGSLETIDKLTHSIKSIDTIVAMEDAGYSNDGSYDGSYDDGSYDDYSYARGRGRNARRDSMGRYSRANRRGGYRDRYSRDDKEDMVEQIEEMMKEASDPSVKEALKKALHSMK